MFYIRNVFSWLNRLLMLYTGLNCLPSDACLRVSPGRKLKRKNAVVHRREDLLRPPLRAATHSQHSTPASSQIHSRKRAMVRDSHHHTHFTAKKNNWTGELFSSFSVTLHRDFECVFVQASEQETESGMSNFRPPAGESAGSASKKIKLSEVPTGRYTFTSPKDDARFWI